MVFQIKTLSPVGAKLVAVGEINHVVIYILRIDFDGRTSYVSRRYSEFRELMIRIQAHANTRGDSCDICNEVLSLGLTRPNGFPSRKLLHSQSLAMSRFDELAVFVRNLMITTQGLLDDCCDIPMQLRVFFLLAPSIDTKQPAITLTVSDLRIIHQTDDELDLNDINSPHMNALHRQHSLVIYQ
ncbi:Aste57867_2729 [Aphanomyces stellatus]|uniref:Aste57867_2729 protein n=1 Tax=Aphanomyces stellatus TaxID=120398 RepID=A0A485KDU9_9STRA|nr:hypothetical protein As57867_002722 [Aphanomyces stellatus]VFT79921.1 Aste57867_2729 [Aphanomyces stellatus]